MAADLMDTIRQPDSPHAHTLLQQPSHERLQQDLKLGPRKPVCGVSGVSPCGVSGVNGYPDRCPPESRNQCRANVRVGLWP
eukprot:1013137-Amphidinium_carterae.1